MLVTSKAIGTVSPWFEGEEVQLWVPLVQHLSDRTRASELVADLNREWPRLKFTLAGDRVAVRTAVPANPYVPQHLIDTLGDLYALSGPSTTISRSGSAAPSTTRARVLAPRRTSPRPARATTRPGPWQSPRATRLGRWGCSPTPTPSRRSSTNPERAARG